MDLPATPHAQTRFLTGSQNLFQSRSVYRSFNVFRNAAAGSPVPLRSSAGSWASTVNHIASKKAGPWQRFLPPPAPPAVVLLLHPRLPGEHLPKTGSRQGLVLEPSRSAPGCRAGPGYSSGLILPASQTTLIVYRTPPGRSWESFPGGVLLPEM
ncbi:MAG: hypothetical protein METHP_01744 [Methanoregula sp. SKADARSKE-2]|nr:MAG: hypothetical protein METHP_01744 [Methanoregula sp. SKADARSKE-2]